MRVLIENGFLSALYSENDGLKIMHNVAFSTRKNKNSLFLLHKNNLSPYLLYLEWLSSN